MTTEPNKMESTPDDRLCDICVTIPFLQLYAKARERSLIEMPLYWSFGRASDVRGRGYCPFCRLICEGLTWDLTSDSDIHIRWGNMADTFQCAQFPKGTKLGFLDMKHRFLDKRIDISRVCRWLSVCSEHHSNCLPHQSTPDVEISNFRVIDVRRRCIAATPNSVRYVALSYVWGQVDTYRLLKSNFKELMKSESLTKNWGKLPRTIRDVIQFTEAIGERYLWIDTLCLIQDDDDDKIPGIKHMDVVYSRAFCTIVAASGEDANAGIPGWGLIRRRAQHVSEVLPGVNLILTKNMATYLRQTRYDKRAWTFQEYFLSPRRIVFVNSQAYYMCRKCYWREDDAEKVDLNTQKASDGTYLSSLNSLWMEDDTDTHEMLTKMLFYYTARQLTYASDILNAMDGICRALSIRSHCGFYQGMPAAALDLYLLFHTVSLSDRRQGFPSYSWAGWHGQIQFENVVSVWSKNNPVKDKNDWLSNHTWIIWYKWDPLTEAVSQVWDANKNYSLQDNDVGYRNRQAFRKSRLVRNIATTGPSHRHQTIRQAQCPYPLLQFWTVSVYFKAFEFKEQDITSVESLDLDLFDRNGHFCGRVQKDKASTDIQTEDSEPVELILLSEDVNEWNPYSRIHTRQKHMEEYSATGTYLKHREGEDSFWALWIRWDGCVAERVGIAQIFQAAMEESFEPGPVWKEILLG